MGFMFFIWFSPMLWLLFGCNTYMAYIMRDQGGRVDRKVVWGNAMKVFGCK